MSLGEGMKAWEALAAKELGRAPEPWETPEGIAVKPLYAEADLAGLSHLGTLPGLAPFVRGVRAT
ncbi:MAG TPA: methylmalonyl-CoA mutase family protein, partial [Paracoccaceae bacterium]|nr:methylmalonyl-CoA mutase family protein [Paracoccaceae bacterium]